MVSAIVLAAGLSSRMDGNKLLLPFKNKLLIVTVVENIINSGIEEIIVVTGKDAGQIHNLLKHLAVIFIYNEDFKKGMTASIKKGISVANSNGYMICLSDMPFITSNEYLQIKNSFEEQRQLNKSCICIPAYKGKMGNPVIFSSSYKQDLLQHTNMEGCKQIVQSNQHNIYPVQMNSDNILKDIDTAKDYQQATS